jgi:hypothetical protein
MSMERFLQIKSALRFDDPRRRNRQDTLAPVRNIVYTFSDKLRRLYVPGQWLTIDEQLLEFHGRVQFQQYIASKPGKFGIKVMWLCDAENFYALNAVIYIGMGTLSANVKVTTKVVSLHFIQHILCPEETLLKK